MKLFIISTLLGLSLAYKYNENKPPELNCDCGWKNEITVGGKGVETIEYPWIAYIVKGTIFWCGATVVTEWHVLTSSRCIGLGGTSESICVGVIDKKNCVKEHQIASFYKKYRISKDDTINDIAIVSSQTKFEFNSYVGPACIPHKLITNKELLKKYVKILVYGGTQVFKDMDVEVVAKAKCESIYTTFRRTSHLCTYTSGHYTCKNDRGGPVAYLDSVTDRYNLIGMLTDSPSVCFETNDNPSLSTNVSDFLSWLEDKIKKDKPGINLCSRK